MYMPNKEQQVAAGAGTASAFLCFFLEIVSANMFWGILGLSLMIFCAGRIYWIHLQETKAITQRDVPLLATPPSTSIHEEMQDGDTIVEGVFRESPKRNPLGEDLPKAPSFPHCVPDMDDTTFILGYACQDGRTVAIKDDMDEGVMSTAVIGKPRRGKTTLLYFFIAQMIMKHAEVVIFDPHATLSKLKTIFRYAHNCDTIISHVPDIHKELDARRARYDENGGVCLDEPFWLVVDELPLLSLHEHMLKKNKIKFQSAIDVIQRVILEGRKFRMYCLISGQSMPAIVLPTLARDNIASRYAFFCSDDHARMSGFTRKTIKDLLPHLRIAVGKCILDAATMQQAMIVAIPYTTADHIYTLVRTHSYSGVSQFSQPAQSVTIPNYGTVDQHIVDRILRAATNGVVTKRADICREVGISNRHYPIVKHVCDEHGLLTENLKTHDAVSEEAY